MRTISEKQKSIIEFINVSEPALPRQNKEINQLEQLKEVCLDCSKCELRKGCSQVVFGDGSRTARLMMVGEGPGADEDKAGIPFVGRAGQLLDRILEAAEIDRKTIYITNIVKCRPPGNRLPLQLEVDSCLPYLKKQIELINPEVLVCLGGLATKTLIDKNAAITRTRGKWHEIDGRRVMATFHPAALLRDPSKKKDVWEDFKQIMKLYKE